MTAALAQKIDAALAEQWGRPVVDKVQVYIPVPPSVNELVRNVSAAERFRAHQAGRKIPGRVKTERYRTWLSAAGNMINRQRCGRIDGDYSITIRIPRSKTRADLGNLEKAVSDLLQQHRVIDNDRLAESIHVGWTDASDLCVVTVCSIGDGP